MSPLARKTASAAAARERGEAALLDATQALVESGRPFGELAISEIAKAAGFSRATFYAYFTDKRALALALGQRMASDLYAATSPWFEGEEPDLHETLEAALVVFSRHRGGVAAVVESATYDAEVGAFWRGLHRRFIQLARERIRRAQPKLTRKQVDARSFVAVWSTERCFTEHLAEPQVRERELLDAVELVWRAALDSPPSPVSRDSGVRS